MRRNDREARIQEEMAAKERRAWNKLKIEMEQGIEALSAANSRKASVISIGVALYLPTNG